MNDVFRRGRRVLYVALAAAMAAGPAQATARKTQPVRLRFAAVAGATPVACGHLIEGLGKTGQAAQLADLRFYVSDVHLVRRDGHAVQVKLQSDRRYQVTAKGHGVTLIDLENGVSACSAGTPGTNVLVRGTVPRGRYVGVRFTVGVPFALDHTDVVSAPAPLNLAGMAWSWQSGRKFAKIEVADPGGATGTWANHAFLVHLGSTGCTGNPVTGQAVRCSAPNLPAVSLRQFDTDRQVVAVDLKALLAGVDVTVNQADEPGCMSGPTNPDCGPVFGAFGLDWRPDGSGTGRPTGKQVVFRSMQR
jgi:uncharacterized repeat protein (TIGR04052 family)